jgi:penicillin-binding protein 1C
MKRVRWGLAIMAVLVGAAAAFVAWPLPASVAAPEPYESLVLQDRHGLDLRTTRARDGSRGGWLSLADIDPDLIRAFVAAEDRRFYDHRGIDLRSVARATLANLRAGEIVSGASTITMQTARLLRGLDRGWTGKVAQTLWAMRLEAHLDKSRILEIYLNRVPLGQGTVGVAAASALYFGSPASNVSTGQAALLAGLARAPSRDNPLIDAARATDRRERVLARMVQLGYVSRADSARAAAEPVWFASPASFAAPHFTTRLLSAIETGAGARNGVALASPATWRYGSPGDGRARSRVIRTGPLRTTLDLELQRAIEAEVRHAVDVLHDRAARHAAAIVIENRTGAILAWVGSPDFFADSAGQVDMVTSLRQPGSTLKPFLFGLAFDRGWTAASVLPDVPRTFHTTTGPYRPQNYDRRFRGPVRVREALASSYNVPAVQLADAIGTGVLLGALRDAGFASLDRSAEHYGLGLALGNGEITLLELANAYRALASGGVWRPVHALADDAERAVHDGRRFLSAGAATLVLDVLSDPVARIPGFGLETPLDLPFPAAAKTGTSRHFTDNWAVATTTGFTVAVWVGNFNGRPMQGVSGITGAGPLLYRTMLQTARRYAPGRLPAPEMAGATPVRICRLSGMLATPECDTMVEWFLPGTEPVRPDDWQRDGRTVLPPDYAEWLASTNADDPLHRNRGPGVDSPDSMPSHGSTNETPLHDSLAQRHIISPQTDDVYERPAGVDRRYTTLTLAATHSDQRVRWFANGKLLASPRWPLDDGIHWILAQWPDGHADSVRITVR